MIRKIADDLIDTFVDKGSCNFRTDFAAHLPPKVFLRIFDVPLPDEPMIRAWMEKMQGQGFRHATPEQKQAQFVAADAAREYFQALILQRFESPGKDFLSEMVHAKYDRDGDLDLHYFVGEATTLYQAAYHNTVYMLSNTMLLFLQNPDQLERVVADLGLLRTAIDESLRRESPVQWLQRIVTQDTEFHGVLLPKGAVVLILYGSANRDDRKFVDPERFWVDRPDVTKEQLAFGHGIHLCLGAPLARLEGIVAFEQVLSRLKNIRLADDNDLSNVVTVNHRGPKTVNIEFDRA
jgi:cytochrome P450